MTSLLLLAKALKEIRSEDFDLAVVFRSRFSTSQGWLAYASRARWRLGGAGGGQETVLGLLLQPHQQASPPRGIHEVERCFYLLGQLRVDSPDKKAMSECVPTPAAAKASQFLAQHGLAGEPGPVVLNITRWTYRPRTGFGLRNATASWPAVWPPGPRGWYNPRTRRPFLG